MSLPGLNNFTEKMVTLIKRELSNLKPLRLYVVTGINIETYTVQIKDARRSVQYDDVQVAGMGLGHLRGVMKLPSIGDWVLVMFLGSDSLQPIVIGTVFDQFSQNQDTLPQIGEDELTIVHKTAGSFITMQQDGTIIARTVDESGNSANGARIRLNPDGSFKLFNKQNYGVEVDSTGAMTLRAVTINSTQTAGSWP